MITADSAENSKELRKQQRIERLKKFRFQPGKSGNPGGKPRKKPITELFEELFHSSEDFEVIKQQIRGVFTGKSGMAKVLLLKDAGERLEGKITQPVAVDGEIKMSLAEVVKKARERVKA